MITKAKGPGGGNRNRARNKSSDGEDISTHCRVCGTPLIKSEVSLCADCKSWQPVLNYAAPRE